MVVANGEAGQPSATHFDPEFGFEAFASHSFYRAVNRSLVKAAFQRLPSSASNRQLTILDMACGTGLITSLIAEVLATEGHKGSILAVDPDEHAIRIARERAAGLKVPVRFVRGSPSDVHAIISNVDVAFFCNAIHLVADKKAAVAQIGTVLSPQGILACNTSFFHGTYVEGTEQFYRLWTRKAIGWLKREQPHVRLTREEKSIAMQWLRQGEYVSLFQEAGLAVHADLEAADMPIDAWRDLGRYRLFIEGALPGVPLDMGAAALEAAVYQVGEELDMAYVPRRWLQLVGTKCGDSAQPNRNGARTGGE